MPLRDRIYLRFFLFHQRYGRMWAALLEGICVFIAATVIGLALFALANATSWAVDQVIERQTRAAKQEAKTYQMALINCLNGGVVSRVGDEVVACEGAVTFRMGGVR